MVDEWKVDFTDDDEDGIQTASFNSQNDAEVWIDNQEVQNRYDNVHFKVVDGPYKVGSRVLTEGKHWPEDYIKTAYNTIKNSPLGQQSWYTDEYLTRDLIGPPIDPNASKQEPVHNINRIDKSDLAHNANKYGILGDFSPLMHKNSNLGFFSTIVRWFIEYSGTSKEKYQEFIERKLDGIIGTLQVILNDYSYDKIKDEIKTKWTFQQFEELQQKISDEAKASSDEKLKGLVKRDDYDLIPIYSYEELHEKFGGSWTGYKGQSEWCHTNGKSTYESWTKNGTQMFFVLAKKDWQKVFQPEYKPTGKDYNAYDEYGLSLIAILVDVATGNLLNETLRWNHIIEPSYTNPGASVDKAFKNSWGALSQAVGMDVKAACEKECKDLKQKLQKEADAANEQVEEILRGKTEINSDTIPKALKNHLTKVVIPNTVTSIWHQAFSECSKLTSVTIPDSVTSIGSNAFSNCSSLTSVTIPNSITNIGSYAFSGCSELMSITIPDSVIIIENSAFRGCSRLTSVTIPDSVTSIGIYAFCDCSNLTSVTIPDSMMSIPAAAFHNCRRLTNMTIPDSVISIGRWAFANCSSLTGVVIPDNVTNIGNSAFFNCSGLTRVTIPDSVTTIESSAFSSCRGLTHVMIPNSVTSIGNWAFDHCDNLKSLVFKGKTPEEVKAMENYSWGIKDVLIIKCEDQEKLLESKKGFDPQEYIKEFKDHFGYEDSYFPERDYSHSYDALAHELALQQPTDTEAREIEGDAVMLLVTSGSEDAMKAGKALGDCMMKKTKHDNETLMKKMRDAYLAVARLNSSTELDESVDRLDNVDAKAKSLRQFNNKTTAFWEKVTKLTDDGNGLGQHVWLRSPNGVLVCRMDDYGEKPTYYVPDIESNQLVEVGYESFSGFTYNYDPHHSFREDMPSDIPASLMESSVGTYSTKIWVDDIRPAPNGYLWLKSVDDFIDYIVEHGLQGIAVIDIDHDAGDYAKFGGDYIKCLDYLESIGASGINVRVHSANPVGVEKMLQIIKRNGWTEVHGIIDEHFTHEEQMQMLFESTPSSANSFKGEWNTLDASHPAYSTVEQSLKDDGLEVGNVHEIGNGQYYIAEIYSRSIDCTDAQRWLKCLDTIKKFIGQMRAHGCGDVWLVDMAGGNGDDGVFTLRVGFTLLSSPFSSDGNSQLDEGCLDEDGSDEKKKKIVDALKDAAKAFTDNAPNSDPEKFADIKVVFDDLASAVGDYDFKKKKVLKEEDTDSPRGE